MKRDLSRRSFLGILGGLFAVFGGLSWLSLRRKPVRVHLAGPALERGHALRQPFAAPAKNSGIAHEVVIIGGGISGMSAGWYLQKQGVQNFQLFELENRAGGNSQWGQNRVGRYPWGAHYLPTPGEDADWVRELLAEMGIFKNGRFSDEALVHETEERLFIYGNWQPGLVPLMGAREADRRQIELFFGKMAEFRRARGRDGRRAFTIPLALSSKDPQFLQYDRLTAAAFLDSLGITSQRLLWYIDYVLRDEYGSNRENTSAWALLHYFAARTQGGAGAAAGTDGIGAAARSESHNLVWPEGNGYVAEYLRQKLGDKIQSATALRQVIKEKGGYTLWFTDHAAGKEYSVTAAKIIFAAPKFILPFVYPQLAAGKKAAAQQLVYSPWLTVNMLVNHFAELEPAWDNVTFGSRSLGYVVAEHQRAGKLPHARTLTFFHAFDAGDTVQSRRQLLQMREDEVLQFALAELERPHAGISRFVEEAGAYRWAHAMVRPVPGFLSMQSRFALATIDDNFFGAHSDLSGMSNFEEAQYQGVTAARRVLGLQA